MGNRLRLMCLLAAGMGGCTVGPDYHRPQTSVPQQWAELAVPASQPATQPAPTPTAVPPSDLSRWWSLFADAQLDHFIERAIAANLNLQIAEARVREARAQRDVVAGGAYPVVGTALGYSRQQPSENGQVGKLARGPIGLIGGGELSQPYSLFQAGFDASWELDLFGGVRRSIEAADANTASAVEQHRDVLVSVVAEVARDYVSLRGLQQRLGIAQANLAAQRATLDLVRKKRTAGVITELDVTRAAAQVSMSESQIPLFERQIQRAMLALALLLKLDIQDVQRQIAAAAPLPRVPAEIPIGLPADLLRRRPDIRRVERTLAAATAQIGVATADLFPRVSLSGRFGLESTELSDFTEWDSRTWTLGPSVRWPLFEGGRIRANIRIQGARQEQALAQYELVVLAAISEVEDNLVAYRTEQSRRKSLADTVQASRQAVELAQLGYEEGATDLLSVLDAQRTLYSAEDALAEADQNVVTSLVALYKALGGGWEMTDP